MREDAEHARHQVRACLHLGHRAAVPARTERQATAHRTTAHLAARHQVILRKHQNYAWLHQLVEHIGRLRDTPTKEEIRTLQIITRLINSPAGLETGAAG